jgi:hypothetical protein
MPTRPHTGTRARGQAPGRVRLEDDAGNVFYRQEPIDNDAWLVERTDADDYGHANITLVITNDDLLAPGSARAEIRSDARAPTR